MIIRGLGAMAWMAAGFVNLMQGNTDVAVISLALGAAYGYSCYKMGGKNKKSAEQVRRAER